MTYHVSAGLHSHSNVLTITAIGNGIVHCESVHTICVDRQCSQPINTGVPKFFLLHFKNRDGPWCCLTKPIVWSAHFLDASAAYVHCELIKLIFYRPDAIPVTSQRHPVLKRLTVR